MNKWQRQVYDMLRAASRNHLPCTIPADVTHIPANMMLEADGMRWISVKDGLPEDCIDQSKDIKNIKVIVAIKAKNGWTVRTQMRCKSTCGGRYGEPLKVTWYWGHFSAGEVTHWMPLPEAPKEEEG